MRKILKWLLFCGLFILAVGGTGYLQRAELFRWIMDLPEYQSEYTSETVEVRMRDGQELETHLFLPEGEGPWPTVLIRDPYSLDQMFCQLMVRYNYACVHQDVRGRYGSSEGEWYPVINERNDGLDTLDWLVKQPWQDGNIATFGSSYTGMVQWAMIDEMPEQVKTVLADVSTGDQYQIVQKNGHFIQGIMSFWALGLIESEVTLNEMAAHRPAAEVNAKFLNGQMQWLLDYMANEDKTGEYWNSDYHQTIRTAHTRAPMPVLMTGAWHDFFLGDQLKVYEELPNRDESLLVIRNGFHGFDSLLDLKDILELNLRTTLQWLDRHLRDQHVAELPETGYLLQDNITGEWAHSRDWPDHDSNMVLHLGGLENAGACDGGSLQAIQAQAPNKVSFVYDPDNPVPSRGGSYNFEQDVADQGNDLCARPDVLSFESDVYTEGFTISGSMQVALKVSSDALDSAFTAKVQEKLADGRVLNIRDDITSLSFRNGALSRQVYKTNDIVDVVFDLTPIQWTLQPGSSIRLDISSSNYPIYNAHPNSDQLWSTLTTTNTAKQTVFSGKLSVPVR